jgi:hypothetical protein
VDGGGRDHGVRGLVPRLQVAQPGPRRGRGAERFLGVDACPAYGRRLVDDGTLAASVVAPANTSLALELLRAFWKEGRRLPARSFTTPSPYPPA